jgi:hypothetical protein
MNLLPPLTVPCRFTTVKPDETAFVSLAKMLPSARFVCSQNLRDKFGSDHVFDTSIRKRYCQFAIGYAAERR